jgi:hypothetical protein
MARFGVTDKGFDLKGLDAILSESFERARQVFDDPDLTATSPLRKVLEVAAAEDAELWKRMEALYYANFVSTATGPSLDLLGEDVGLPRDHLFAEGAARFTLQNGAPGRTYRLPEGTVVTTATGTAFHTLAPLELSVASAQGTADVRAFERGPQGNVGVNAIDRVEPEYAQHNLNLGAATLQVQNQAATTGGETKEADEDYRTRLLGRPRNIWTLESVRREVEDVPGVIDVLVSDTLGGVDVSQSYFNIFDFGERQFSSERRLGEPYFFDVVVAHEFERPWRTQGPIRGIYERADEAVDRVRPAGIHANIIEADHIEVGVRARVILDAGQDVQALIGQVKQRLARDVAALRLGSAVLFSQTMRAFVDQPGVVDVQDVHLRRCPGSFGRISFGGVPFQSEIVEAPVGENLRMGRTEIAVFRLDSEMIQIEAESR